MRLLPTCCVVVASGVLLLSSLGEAAPVSSWKGFRLETTIDCHLCEAVASIIQALLREKRSEDFIADVVTRICVSLKFENVDSTVCSGIVHLFKVSDPRPFFMF